METLPAKRHSRRPAGALALPLSRIPHAWRPLHCVLAHLSEHVGGDAQHALIWLAVHAAWPSGLVEVGHRRLVAVSGMADHAMRAALKELDKNGWAPIVGRGRRGVHRRQVALCDGCQRGNSRHAEPAASVAMSYMLEPGRQNGQRGNSRHETEELQVAPAATAVIPGNRPAAASTNDHRPGDVPPSLDPSRARCARPVLSHTTIRRGLAQAATGRRHHHQHQAGRTESKATSAPSLPSRLIFPTAPR